MPMSRRQCGLLCGMMALLVIEGVRALGAERPNIIFMLSDDQAWNGLSVAMHPDVAFSKGEIYRTPNLERLAEQGMRFSAAYAPASVCSPTRISLQTGKSPAALHWTKAAPAEQGRQLLEPTLIKHIDVSEMTIGEALRSAGYATAHYGKWHIAGGGPGRHGYDAHDGDTGNEQAYQFTASNPVDIFGMADRAAAFMEQNATAGRPFYIQLSWNALHASENALPATLAKYQHLATADNSKRATTAAITEDLDTGVGRVLEAVDRLGLTANTYVIYMSDNGAGSGGGGRGAGGGGRGDGGRGDGGRRGLSGGKGSVWEGGIRVPLIVRGPGVAPNSWCHTRVVGYDFYPTFCDWAGIPSDQRPSGLEGGSLVTLLTQGGAGTVRRPREELVFPFPHYQSADGPHTSLILRDLKLIRFYETGRLALFDLSRDISESNDLASQRPDDVARLNQLLTDYLAAVDAQMPVVNPDFDADRPVPPRKQGRRGMGKNQQRPPSSRTDD